MSIPFSQKVRDLVESMQNCVLMGSPYFTPTACTRSCWIDAESCADEISPTGSTRSCLINAEQCADGISPFFAHRKYVILLDQCRIVCLLCLVLLFPTASTLFSPPNAQFCHHCVSSCACTQSVRHVVGSMQSASVNPDFSHSKP